MDGTRVGETRIISSSQFHAGFSGWRDEVEGEPAELEGHQLLKEPADWDPLSGTIAIPVDSGIEFQGVYQDFDVTGNWYVDLPLALRVRVRGETIFEGREERRSDWANRDPALIVRVSEILENGKLRQVFEHTIDELTNEDWSKQPDYRVELGPRLRSLNLTKFRVSLVRQSFVDNGVFQTLEIDEVRLETQDESNWNPAPIADGTVKEAVDIAEIAGAVTPYQPGDGEGICVKPPKDYSGSDLAFVTLADPYKATTATVASIDYRNTDDDPPVVMCPTRSVVVYGGEAVQLSGTSGMFSYDPEGKPLRYEWSTDSGEPLLRGVGELGSGLRETVSAVEAVFPAPYLPEEKMYKFVHQVKEAGDKEQSAECVTEIVVRPFPETADIHVCPEDPNAEIDLAEALKKAEGGDVIEFCAGTHTIGGFGKAWTINKQVTLRCESRDDTILQGAYLDKPVLSVRASNVRIQGCTIEDGSVGIVTLPGEMLSSGYWVEYRIYDDSGNFQGVKQKWKTKYVYEWFDNIRIVGNRIHKVDTAIQFKGTQALKDNRPSTGVKNVWVNDNILEAYYTGVSSHQGVTGSLHIVNNEIRGHQVQAIDLFSIAKRGRVRGTRARGFLGRTTYTYIAGAPLTTMTVSGNWFYDNESGIKVVYSSHAKYRPKKKYGKSRWKTVTFRTYCDDLCYTGNTYATRASENAPVLHVDEPLHIHSDTTRVKCNNEETPACVPVAAQASPVTDGEVTRASIGTGMADPQIGYTVLTLPNHGSVWCAGEELDRAVKRLREDLSLDEWDCSYMPKPGFVGKDKFRIGAVYGNSDMTTKVIRITVFGEEKVESVALTEVVNDEGELGDPIQVGIRVTDPEGDHALYARLTRQPECGLIEIENETLTYSNSVLCNGGQGLCRADRV